MNHDRQYAFHVRYGVTAFALLLTSCAAVIAQQDTETVNAGSATRSGPLSKQSDLAKDNLNRVAASPILLKEALAGDPGLMVELKQWIAEEATDNGQMVKDAELTDDAVYERLKRDVKFRAVATRLVQRYGYLVPNVNPGSELGKSQDLVLKERARRLVRIEAQEDEESLGPSRKSKDPSEAKADGCALGSGVSCAPPAPEHQGRSSSVPGPFLQKSPALESPEAQSPAGTTPRLLKTENVDSPPYEVPENGVLQNVSTLGNSQNVSGSTDLRSTIRNTPGGDLSPSPSWESNNNESGEPTSLGPTTINTKTRLASGRESSFPNLVRRSNPYADIPSLYDLYVQAPARDMLPQRFGSAVFHDGLRDPRSIPMDLPVGPDYVVGPGDSLNINLWGNYSSKLVRIVDRQGRVNLPDAGPLLVSGHSLGEIQQSVQKVVAGLYRDTSVDVSVARLRTIRIYVVGEVADPGAYDISSLSTALNALVAAGGVTAKGSLRALAHMRGRQEIERIDAYDLLLHGVSPDAKKLENGDTLLVPPVSAEVTVTGMVRRPAVYELNGERTINDVLALAGGILPAAALKRVEVQRLEAHKKSTMLTLDLSANDPANAELGSFRVQDGDIIHIFPIAPYAQDMVYLEGHVVRPGRYSFREGMKLADLIASYQDILPEPANYAEVIRLNSPDFHPSVVSFDLSLAMKDSSLGPVLQPLDTVRLFSRFDFEPPPSVSVTGAVAKPGTYRTSGQLTLRDAVYLAGGLNADASLENAQVFRYNADGTSGVFTVKLGEALSGSSTENLLLQPRDRLLIHTSRSRVQPSFVEITGEVVKPGRYPYAENMRADDLIRAAGGLQRSADTAKADLTRYAEDGTPGTHRDIVLATALNGDAAEGTSLRPGDVLSIREKSGWKDVGASVKIEGEVLHAGTFGISPGERLSSVLARAGGYSPQAYPYGAVLTRRDVRESEELDRASLVQRIKTEEGSLQVMPEADEQQKNAKATALAQIRSTLHQLEVNPPVGRVVVHIDGHTEKWKNTSADPVLKDGDVLFIPSTTGYVMVNGQVFHPTAVGFRSGKSANWYLSQAGGLTPLADKKAAFVLRADGSVISARNNSSLFAGDPLNSILRSGDVVVVPEKALKVGGPNWAVIMQAASVAASAAVAVAYFHP